MITEETTTVYVRVDLASRRVISVSDQPLVNRPGRPVFQVSSNSPRLDYYVIEENASATHGITVRAATSAERTAADEAKNAYLARVMAEGKFRKAIQIKDFFDEIYIRRFFARGFYTTLETLAAASYDGTDTGMIDTVVPKAKKINQAYNEWRHLVCQPAIDAMLAADDLGRELNDEYRNEIQDELDTFLTDRDFDITVYSR